MACKHIKTCLASSVIRNMQINEISLHTKRMTKMKNDKLSNADKNSYLKYKLLQLKKTI